MVWMKKVRQIVVVVVTRGIVSREASRERNVLHRWYG